MIVKGIDWAVKCVRVEDLLVQYSAMSSEHGRSTKELIIEILRNAAHALTGWEITHELRERGRHVRKTTVRVNLHRMITRDDLPIEHVKGRGERSVRSGYRWIGQHTKERGKR